jgi:hypothetical protein
VGWNDRCTPAGTRALDYPRRHANCRVFTAWRARDGLPHQDSHRYRQQQHHRVQNHVAGLHRFFAAFRILVAKAVSRLSIIDVFLVRALVAAP